MQDNTDETCAFYKKGCKNKKSLVKYNHTFYVLEEMTMNVYTTDKIRNVVLLGHGVPERQQ